MKRVIIAEDIKKILEEEQNFLRRADVRTFAVSSNAQALALHRAQKADLIIVNLDSPEMGGEILCSLIREDKELRKVSIIILSSHTESDAKRCLQCRANASFTSPPHSAILLETIHQLLHIAPRRSLRIPLSIQIDIVSKGRPFIAYSENISVSGMLLYSEAPLFKGDTITCSFYLPDLTHIKVNAEIVRILEKETEHDTNYYGIRFINAGTDCRSAIETFVEKQYRHNV
jgi:CheY-like chemotaxis protein